MILKIQLHIQLDSSENSILINDVPMSKENPLTGSPNAISAAPRSKELFTTRLIAGR